MKSKNKNKEKIYECEVKRPHQNKDGERYLAWIRREVALVDDKDPVRCYECKGKVRIHRKRKPNGPKDHVEHITSEDSEGCSLGDYFMGVSKKSSNPVE